MPSMKIFKSNWLQTSSNIVKRRKHRQTSSNDAKDANEIKLIEAAIWGDSTLQFTETLVSIVIW